MNALIDHGQSAGIHERLAVHTYYCEHYSPCFRNSEPGRKERSAEFTTISASTTMGDTSRRDRTTDATTVAVAAESTGVENSIPGAHLGKREPVRPGGGDTSGGGMVGLAT